MSFHEEDEVPKKRQLTVQESVAAFNDAKLALGMLSRGGDPSGVSACGFCRHRVQCAEKGRKGLCALYAFDDTDPEETEQVYLAAIGADTPSPADPIAA